MIILKKLTKIKKIKNNQLLINKNSKNLIKMIKFKNKD